MAITLTCLCDPNAMICTLESLTWIGETSKENNGSIGEDWSLYLTGAGGLIKSVLTFGSGSFSIALTPLASWAAAWGSLQTALAGNSSLFQVPDPPYSQNQTVHVQYWIEQVYQCTNLITGEQTTRTVKAFDGGGDKVTCETGPGDIRAQVEGGTGVLSGIFYKSTPFGACNGATTHNFDYKPDPTEDKIDIDKTDHICLCVSGDGSGNYTFSVVTGDLPCGQSLNAVTGCIEGEPDGSCPGSDSITFRVVDSGPDGHGVDITNQGFVNVFGTGMTRVAPAVGDPPIDTGSEFDLSMVGAVIKIPVDGVLQEFTIVDVADSDHLTVDRPIGILSHTTWSYTYSTPPPDFGPPKIAEVTCGFIGGGCGEGIGVEELGNTFY